MHLNGRFQQTEQPALSRTHHLGESAMDRASLLASRRETPDDYLAIAVQYCELKDNEGSAIIRHHFGVLEQSYRALAETKKLLICLTASA